MRQHDFKPGELVHLDREVRQTVKKKMGSCTDEVRDACFVIPKGTQGTVHQVDDHWVTVGFPSGWRLSLRHMLLERG